MAATPEEELRGGSSDFCALQLQLRCHSSAIVKPLQPEIPLFCRAQRSAGVVGLRLADLQRFPFPMRGDQADAVSASPVLERGAGRKVSSHIHPVN